MVKKFKRIVLDAYFDNNFGDDLFFDLLSKQYPQALFYVFFDKSNHTVYEKLEEKSNVVILPGNCEAQKGFYDGFIMIGGDVLPDGMNFERRINLMTAVKNSGGFVAMLGFNLCEKYGEKAVSDLDRMASLADVIVTRDEISAIRYRNMVPEVQVISAADMAFTAKLARKSGTKNSILGMSVRCKLYSTDEEFDLYAKGMAKIADTYLTKNPNGCVRMLAFSVGEYDDREVAARIIELMNSRTKDRVEIRAYDGDINGFIRVYEECDAVVATRFHALVLALMLRIPFVPVPYEVKITQLLEQLEYHGIVIPYAKSLSEDMIPAIMDSLGTFSVSEECMSVYEGRAAAFFEKTDILYAEKEKSGAPADFLCPVIVEKNALTLEREQLKRDLAFKQKENEELNVWVKSLQQEKASAKEQLNQSEKHRKDTEDRLMQTLADYKNLEQTNNNLKAQLEQSEELRNDNWNRLIQATKDYAKLEEVYKTLLAQYNRVTNNK